MHISHSELCSWFSTSLKASRGLAKDRRLSGYRATSDRLFVEGCLQDKEARFSSGGLPLIEFFDERGTAGGSEIGGGGGGTVSSSFSKISSAIETFVFK